MLYIIIAILFAVGVFFMVKLLKRLRELNAYKNPGALDPNYKDDKDFVPPSEHALERGEGGDSKDKDRFDDDGDDNENGDKKDGDDKDDEDDSSDDDSSDSESDDSSSSDDDD